VFAIAYVSLYVWNNMQREEMGIVDGNPMGMGISMVWEWEWEWLYGNGREWESERHSRTPLVGILHK